MKGGYQEISFEEAFPQTCYLEYYKNILADFLMEHFIDDNSNRFFLFTNNENKKIFLLEKKLKATFTKKTFEIPILVYFPENFPSTPPEIYIEKRSDHLEINKKIPPNFIDRNTLRIHFEIIFNWNKTTESIIKLFETLENIFSKHFPTTPPEIYLEKRSDHLEINKKIPPNFIDRNTLRIHFEIIFNWNKTIESIIKLFETLEKIFSKNFPIFQSKNKLLVKGLCQLNINNCIPITKMENFVKKKYTNESSSGTPKGNISQKESMTPGEYDNVITPGVSFENSSNDIFSDDDLKNPIIPKLKEKLFDLIIQKQNEFRNINLELNQIKNILNKKLILFDQVNKNLNMIMSFEKKLKMILIIYIKI